MLPASMTCFADFVSGRIIETVSMIWNCACRLWRTGFWPVIISIGMPPREAWAAAVTRLVAPGPSVLRQTPGFPVSLP